MAEGINRSYLVYKKQIRYRSDKLINSADDLAEAEYYIDEEVNHYLASCLLDVDSAEWQQMKAVLYNAYYIRIMPEVK